MKLSIITPEREVFCGKIKSVVLPGTLGLFEVLENHAPLVSSLGAGTAKIVTESGEEKNVEILSGFVEVRSNELCVCVEGAKEI